MKKNRLAIIITVFLIVIAGVLLWNNRYLNCKVVVSCGKNSSCEQETKTESGKMKAESFIKFHMLFITFFILFIIFSGFNTLCNAYLNSSPKLGEVAFRPEGSVNTSLSKSLWSF